MKYEEDFLHACTVHKREHFSHEVRKVDVGEDSGQLQVCAQ